MTPKMRVQVVVLWTALLLSVCLVARAALKCGPAALHNCTAPTPCCSISSNECGNTTAHCGVGCLSPFSAPGACAVSSEESTSRVTTIAASDQRCGRQPGNSSKNYGPCQAPGYCCSFAGYCGVGDDYCIGCQKSFGRCPIVCDGSKPCGIYGMVSFVFSCITIILAVLTTCVSIFYALRSAHIDNRSIFSFCNRH